MQYALITAAAAIVRYEDFDNPPPALAGAKGLRWLPVTDVIPEPGDGETLTGPDVAVTNDAVTRTWAVVPAPPPVAPMVVGKAQAVVILSRIGQLDAVEADITALGAEAVLAWQAASEIRRDGVIIAAVAARRGWSEAFVCDLFRTAAALRL